MVGADEHAWRLRQVVDGSRDAFVEIDGSCFVTEWSRQAEVLLGWSRAEMTGRTVLDLVADRFVEVVEQGVAVLRSRLASGEIGRLPSAPSPLVLDVELRRRSGSPLRATASVFVTAPGPELRIGTFFRDVEEEVDATSPDRLSDPLTGLPTRELFLERLGTAVADLRRNGGSVSVVGLGIDRFKAITDAMGHDAGDDLLVAVAARLRLAGGAVRPVLCRLGAEEFLALFEHSVARGVRDAESFAERALAALGEPFDIGGSEVFVTASVGIATTDDPGADPTSLVSGAEAALHEGAPAGGFRLFGAALREQIVERLHTEHSLHRALDRDELLLHYQPVVDVFDGSVVGVEALVRWDHPDHGLVYPDRFVPVAEESGLIIPIGAWVLGEACRQQRRWMRWGVLPAASSVEVNLSARQLDHPDLVRTVESALEGSGLAPAQLTLELTESALMGDAAAALEVLRALKSIGVLLAIDDFGTGYSSLSYLHRLPLDVLKVDKAFVDGLDTGEGAEIAGTVVDLAHALGLDVVAEGVETPHQLEVLRQMGCDHAQGFLFSRPVPAIDLAARLESGRGFAPELPVSTQDRRVVLLGGRPRRPGGPAGRARRKA